MDEKKRPNRTGVALNTFLPLDLNAAMEKYVSDQEVEPKKTTVVQKAIKDYLAARGYIPGAVVKPADAHASETVRLHAVGGFAPVKFVGPVAAGTALEVFDQPHETIDLAEFLGGKGRFVFVVKGTSMEEEHIYEGDQVVVQRMPEPKTGDIVVVRYNGGLMIKKLTRRTAKETRVVSCDGKETNYVLDESRGDSILGKYVGMYRKQK